MVEERSMAHPRLREAFAEVAKRSGELAFGTPGLKDRGLFVRSPLDLRRPELMAAKSRLDQAMTRSSKKAVLAPGRARGRPARTGGEGADDVYLVHPALGPYPAELEFLYPFSQTEASGLEAHVGLGREKVTLKKMGYSRVSVPGKQGKKSLRSRRSRWAASPSPR